MQALIKAVGVAQLVVEGQVSADTRAAPCFARRLRMKQTLTLFMRFPDGLRNAGFLNAWCRFRFSCLHFDAQRKAGLLRIYTEQVLEPQGVPNRLRVIDDRRNKVVRAPQREQR